ESILGAVDDPLDARRGAVNRWERLDERVAALAPVLRRDRGGDPIDLPQLRGDGVGVAALLDQRDERLEDAGRDAGRRQGVAACDRVARAREVLHLRLVRV